jgi:oligopeptide transport system permease protein
MMVTEQRLETFARAEAPRRHPGLWGDAVRRLRRNRFAVVGVFVIALMALAAIFAPVIQRHDPEAQDLKSTLQDPSGTYWFGTDKLGRDNWSRVVHGARISLTVGVVTEAIAVVIGVLVGSVAALGGSRLDNLVMRFTDVAYAFPSFLLIILVVSAFGTSFQTIFLAIALVSWTDIARLVRGQMLALRERDFVLAARCLGAPPWRIVFRHMLPNTLGPVIALATFGVPSAIFAEAVLSFIGLGLPPPTPSWGILILDGYRAINAVPALVFFPALAIALLMMAFTFLGDGLRDALDPRAR